MYGLFSIIAEHTELPFLFYLRSRAILQLNRAERADGQDTKDLHYYTAQWSRCVLKEKRKYTVRLQTKHVSFSDTPRFHRQFMN